MNNDIVAYYYDSDGNREEMRLSDVYMTFRDMAKVMYFDFHMRCPEGTFEQFLEIQMKMFVSMLTGINETYQEHMEGMRRDLMLAKRKDDPIRAAIEEYDRMRNEEKDPPAPL